MTPRQRADHADRILAIWTSCKIPHDELVRGLEGFEDDERMTEAITALSRKQSWAPTIANVLAEYMSTLPPKPGPTPTPRFRTTTHPGLAHPDAPADSDDRFELDPAFCADGLERVAQLRALMAESAANARAKRKATAPGTPMPTTPPPPPSNDVIDHLKVS